MAEARPWLGVGLGLRFAHLEALHGRLREGLPLPPVFELTVSHAFAQPARFDALAARGHLVLHDVHASLGTAGPLDRDHLERVAALARRFDAVDYSEHLAMTRSPGGIDLGHLVPLPRTRAQLELLVTRVCEARELLALPVALELPTTSLVIPTTEEELDEGAFVSELVARSGCELHLDLENLRVDALNFGFGGGLGPTPRPGSAAARHSAELDAALRGAGVPAELAGPIARRLAGLPLAAVSRVHLAGGHLDSSGWAVDSHSAPVPAPTLALLAALRDHIEPRAIILERDHRLPPLTALLRELEEIQALWAGARGPREPR